jgi:hypothetical protein
LVLLVGGKLDQFLSDNVKGTKANYVETDEIWTFVGCKAKHAATKNLGDEVGDAWSGSPSTARPK